MAKLAHKASLFLITAKVLENSSPPIYISLKMPILEKKVVPISGIIPYYSWETCRNEGVDASKALPKRKQ
ncbi:MAG TPA: hypothetical protein VMF88_11670 [Bacteroidota bacterium]|nr:hypothetical protein [Bacteroidota bacterium]